MPAQEHKLLLILNPVAGKTDPLKLQMDVENWAKRNNWHLRVFLTQLHEDLKAILRQMINEEQAMGAAVSVVAVAGGDGTVSEVMDAMHGIDLPLLLLSTGSTNVYALNFAIPADPMQSLNLLSEEHELRHVDLMSINGRCRMMNAGVGFNSNLILYTTREEKRRFGVFAYFRNIARSVRMMKQADFVLTIDDVRESIHAAEVFVINVGFGIADWINNDEFKPDDGVISVYVLRPSNMRTGMIILKNMLFGRKREKEIICHYLVKNSLTVECDQQLIAQSDGEIIGTTPLTIRVLPASVTLITPKHRGIYIPLDYVNKYILDVVNQNPFH